MAETGATATPRKSITRRLILILTGAIGSLWLAAVIASSFVTLHEVNEVFDSALQETAQRLVGLAAHHFREGDEYDSNLSTPQTFGAHEEYLIYQIRDPQGRVLLRSHDAPDKPFSVPLEPGFADAKGLRVYTETTADRRLFVQVAETDAHRYEAVYGTLLALLLPLTALLPLAALAIFLTVRRSVAPLGVVQREIRRRSGSHLDAVPTEDLPAELVPIVLSVNRLLERLSRALDAEKSFAANSAHELRTPVAAARAQAQLLATELPEGPSAARARALADTMTRLSKLVEKLLQLAKAGSGVALTRQDTDLGEIVAIVVGEYRSRQVAKARLVLEPEPLPKDIVHTDPDALGIVLQNLIDNALAHGDRALPVRVRLGPGPVVSVANHGAVVPADQLARLTNRFVRGQTRSEGSGLGLSIVETIMLQAGGKLELFSPARGEQDGFEAVLTFPSAEP